MGIAIKSESSKNANEIPSSNLSSRPHSGAFSLLAAQCAACFGWRIIDSMEEYEKLRSTWSSDPFVCTKLPNISCDDPSDIKHMVAQRWAIDCPDVPKTPVGFERQYIQQKDKFSYDVYYVAPSGRKLTTPAEVTSFLNENPEFSRYLSVSDFSFASPVIKRPRRRPVIGRR